MNYLTFEDSKYVIHTKDKNNNILDVIRYLSPRAWAKTAPGRYFYEEFLPMHRKENQSDSWKFLEKLHRKNILGIYSESSEYEDPEIPFD